MHINKFAYAKGGAEIYMLRTAAKQSKAGHHVSIFGSNPEGRSLPNGMPLFAVDVPSFHEVRGMARVNASVNVLWSKPAARRLDEAITAYSPDVLHLHNYAHQLSPSIIHTIRRHRIPTVYTAHDYKLICPAYVASVDGRDCFACSHKVNARVVAKKCHHGSRAWSGIVALEAIEVRALTLVPDFVIAPSQFMCDALRDSWLGSRVQLRTIRNPAEPSKHRWEGGGDYLLYVGRLSPEKGIMELVSAAGEVGVRVVLAGDGPLRGDLVANSDPTMVVMAGHVDESALALLRKDCIAQVVPSTWPENAPLSALEAAIDGVPLITSCRGGLLELRQIGARLVGIESMSAQSLESAITSIRDNTGDQELFARATSWERHLAELDDVYRSVVTSR